MTRGNLSIWVQATSTSTAPLIQQTPATPFAVVMMMLGRDGDDGGRDGDGGSTSLFEVMVVVLLMVMVMVVVQVWYSKDLSAPANSSRIQSTPLLFKYEQRSSIKKSPSHNLLRR